MSKEDTSELEQPDNVDAADHDEIACEVDSHHETEHDEKDVNELGKTGKLPCRFRTAFILFSSCRHKQIRKEMGTRGVMEKTSNIAKLVSRDWKKLTPSERQEWEQKARDDKARYDREMDTYLKAIRKQGGGQAELPKRPMSAYLAFSNSRRAGLKRMFPEASNSELSKMLSKAWQTAPPEIKARYVDEEARLRAKYNNDIMPYRNKQPKCLKKQAAVAAAAAAAEAIDKQQENQGNDLPEDSKGKNIDQSKEDAAQNSNNHGIGAIYVQQPNQVHGSLPMSYMGFGGMPNLDIDGRRIPVVSAAQLPGHCFVVPSSYLTGGQMGSLAVSGMPMRQMSHAPGPVLVPLSSLQSLGRVPQGMQDSFPRRDQFLIDQSRPAFVDLSGMGSMNPSDGLASQARLLYRDPNTSFQGVYATAATLPDRADSARFIVYNDHFVAAAPCPRNDSAG